MRAALACLAVFALAGCTQTGTTVINPSSGPTAQPAALAGGWQLDCALGSYEQAHNASWGQACEARASHNPGPKEETWAQINPTNPLNVVVGAKDLDPSSSAHCVWNGVFVTHDGGKTWKDVTIGGSYKDRTVTSPYYGYACNTDPDFRFDAKGDLHYGVEMYNLNNGGEGQACAVPVSSVDPTGLASCGFKILLATSHDGGDTWPDVMTYQPDIVLTTDFSRMAISPTTQTVLEAIGSEGGVGCNVLRWAKGAPAATFEPVATKDGIPCNSGGGAGIAVSPTGTVVLAGAAGVVARSTDDGVSFPDSNPLFPFNPIPGSFKESKYRTTDIVETAYDTVGPNKGTLYACYPAADRQGDEADVYVRSSKDDGRTWSPAVMVNHDAPGAHQWMCNLGVASDGSVHVFFFDKQYDPTHVLIDVTHGVSLDGGKTWATERVSTVSFDGNLGRHQEGFPFIGDYIGADCAGLDCWAGFPDASNGHTTVIAAAHVHKVG